jgi:hypothetical protein
MIQFNLLPSVKLEYIKARRTKRLVMVASAVVTGVSLTIIIMLFVGTSVIQHKHLDNLQADIDRDSKALQNTPELDKILTIQNQLIALNGVHDGKNVKPGLHDQKPVADRLGTYLPQLVPNALTISKLDVDFDATTMSFEGAATGVDVVNKFIDTLKFTSYKAGEQNGSAFSEVVLVDFTRTNSAGKDGATYQVSLKFSPVIFDSANAVQLQVPNIISTRSTTQKPTALFEEIKKPAGGTQ